MILEEFLNQLGNTLSKEMQFSEKRGISLDKHTTYSIDGGTLTIEDVVRVAKKECLVELSAQTYSRMNETRNIVEKMVAEEKIEYGITTGFGKFSNVVISREDAMQLQKNLIMSHACGVGDPFPEEVVRAMMFLKANEMSKGYSGTRPATVDTLVQMINRDVIPVVPEQGSLGASGDLAPMAHIVLVLIGLGEAYYKGERMPGQEAMAHAQIQPVILAEKEGLSLINGTHAMSALGCLAVSEMKSLLASADIVCALTMEGLRGVVDAFDPRVHAIRPHRGQTAAAANILRLLQGSDLTTRQGELRIQDAYSLRCTPQVHGASRDAFAYVHNVIDLEINSATDNPLIFADDEAVISGGNFHGQPLALALDFLAIAASEIANISERRLERLVNHQLNDLPPFLTKGKGGLNSGFMIAQYAAASLVSENKVLAHPASVDSIPSSANQEDHVSMGTTAARKGRTVIKNALNVLAIEYLAASQAIDLRNYPGSLGAGTKPAYELIRQSIPPLTEDRVMYPDIHQAADLIRTNALLSAVKNHVPELE